MLTVVLALLLILAVSVRRPVLALAGCFLLFSFVWRLVAAAYLESGAPVFAEELQSLVGGPGAGTAFGLVIALTVALYAWLFRPAALARGPAPPTVRLGAGAVTLGDAAFWVFVLLVAALYADMARRGVVPLLAGMERYDYATQYAGPLHAGLFKYGQLLTLLMGSLLVYPRLLGQVPDWRFLGLFLVVMVYCLLTGHRFSAFYAFGSYFLMPAAAVLLLRGRGELPPSPPARSLVGRCLGRWQTWLVLGVLGVLLVGGALAHSFINVRDYGDQLADKFAQRMLVQPIQMWWLTWARVWETGLGQPGAAAEFMFVAPIDATRNTGIQWLMLQALGPQRAGELLRNGQQYAGGFPEVVFELFGAGWAWPVVVVLALVSGWLLRSWLLALTAGRHVTAFCAMYVFYALTILYNGGMVNFLVQLTFWVKLAGFGGAWWLERSLQREGLALLPWVLWRRV